MSDLRAGVEEVVTELRGRAEALNAKKHDVISLGLSAVYVTIADRLAALLAREPTKERQGEQEP